MVSVKFLSYVKKLTGVSEYHLQSNPRTVEDALYEIAKMFPKIKELILDEIPEVSFILGDRTLVTPRDLVLPIDKDLIIGPIVAGG